MDTKKTAIACLMVFAFMLILWNVSILRNANQGMPTGNAISLTANGDLFEGKITNKNVVPGKFEGTGVYDRNCVQVGGGLTNCHAGIKTEKYGVLDFNYVHNMAEKPCIAPNDAVVVEILNSDGDATVQKVNPNKRMH